MVVSTAPTTTRHLGTDQQRAGTDLAAFLDAGENPPDGAIVYYLFDAEPGEPIELSFLDGEGELIKTFTSRLVEGEAVGEEQDDADDDEKKASRFAPAKQGLNRFVWDLLHEDATRSTEDSSRRDKHEPLMRSTDCDAFSARSWRYLGGPRSQ